jgi:hypothetical protein
MYYAGLDDEHAVDARHAKAARRRGRVVEAMFVTPAKV